MTMKLPTALLFVFLLPVMSLTADTLSTRPCLALITEPDACKSDERMEETFQAIQSAVSSRKVSLVSIRLDKSNSTTIFNRAVELTRRLVSLSSSGRTENNNFQVVCSSDWVQVAVQARAHGVHVKEMHLSKIPEMRKLVTYPLIIGTSAHSVESALSSYETYQPDYYFVGTCFTTQSHPEKSAQDLEGPMLPGQVRETLLKHSSSPLPKVMAIGGISHENCDIPVHHGADGVAVIRSVMQAEDPANVVLQMHSKMNAALESPSETSSK